MGGGGAGMCKGVDINTYIGLTSLWAPGLGAPLHSALHRLAVPLGCVAPTPNLLSHVPGAAPS